MLDLLKTIWKYWKKLADWVLETFFQIVLFIFYFTIFVPFALIFNLTDKDAFSIGWKSSTASSAEDLY